MTCKTHIIECLNNNVKLESSSVLYSYDQYRNPENALVYDTNNYFASDKKLGEWWQIDFKRTVAISSYTIVVLKQCDYVHNWTISLSLNNRTFIKVDEHNGYYPSGIYQLGKTYNTRYLRISGNADSACTTETKKILAFNYVYFYGSLTPINSLSCHCKKCNQVHAYIFVMLLVLCS